MRMNMGCVCISCASAWSVSLVQQSHLVHGGTA